MIDEALVTKEQFDAAFGSEEALGVYMVLEGPDGPGESVSLEAYAKLCEGKSTEDYPGAASTLPHGGSAICCTDYATHIFLKLPGRVQIVGFHNKDNPTSRCAREEFHCGGHDFAIVDGRFIVDPWPRLVPMVMEQAVFDLTDPLDVALALDVYGPRECWKPNIAAEAYAMGLAKSLSAG